MMRYSVYKKIDDIYVNINTYIDISDAADNSEMLSDMRDGGLITFDEYNRSRLEPALKEEDGFNGYRVIITPSGREGRGDSLYKLIRTY